MKMKMLSEMPRDLPLILRTEAANQRKPPLDYAIAEDGGRMVVKPAPDIAMAELLEEAATALDRLSERVTVKPLDLSNLMRDAFLAGRGAIQGLPVSDEILEAWAAYEPPEKLLNRILAAIDTAPARDPWMLEASDDGTEIHLSGYAGGAAPGGAWSTLTLMRKRPGHPVEMRDYTADGDWSSDGVPQAASKRIDTAPTPSPDQIRREALREAIAVVDDFARAFGNASLERLRAATLRSAAARIEALITGGDDGR